MTIGFTDVLEALLWSAVAGLAVWFLLLPVRRRTYIGLLVSLVLTGTAASTGALYGGMQSHEQDGIDQVKLPFDR